MLIADLQVHIWGADTPERPWPAGRAHQAQKPYPVTADMLLKEMLADAGLVTGALRAARAGRRR